MKKNDKTFVEKLIELEKTNQTCRDKYEKEMKNMLEKKLNNIWRVIFAILSILGFLGAIPFWEFATEEFRGILGEIIRVLAILGWGLTIAWMITMGWIAIKGRLNLKNQPARIAAIGSAWGFFKLSQIICFCI